MKVKTSISSQAMSLVSDFRTATVRLAGDVTSGRPPSKFEVPDDRDMGI